MTTTVSTATILKYPLQKKPYHKASLLFPLMDGAEFKALVEDIKANGLTHPIILCDGRVLDGRNRDRACRRAGVQPRYENYMGDDPFAYVISANVMRRHLTRKQVRDLIRAEIKRRPELSDFAIAKLIKVSQNTVARARQSGGRFQVENVIEKKRDSLGRMQPTTRRTRGKGKKRIEVKNEGCNYNPALDTHDVEGRRRSMVWFNEQIVEMMHQGCERFTECDASELDDVICDGLAAVDKAYVEWKRLSNSKRRMK